VGFTLKRVSERIKAKRKATPVALAAETMVCRGLGIVQDGEEVTELSMAEFARHFKGEVSDQVMAVMRALFRVGSPADEALLQHGGAAVLDHDELEDEVEVANA
jgi:hypothetical protein